VNIFVALGPVVIPAILGAWLVLTTRVGAWPQRFAWRVALGAFTAMIIALALFVASPWFQTNNVHSTRDDAAVAAAAPYVGAVWLVLVAVLFLGVGGWLAAMARKGGAMALLTGLLIFVAAPAFVFFATILIGCFFAGACF
jgi:hypothetical protein